jgi:hypothetical protein
MEESIVTQDTEIDGTAEDKRFLSVSDVARMAHETNRVWCDLRGDSSQTSWEEAPMWQKDSANKGVQMHLDHPRATPEKSHESWMGEKVDAGWVYGLENNPDAEPPTHPCILPYEDLPPDQQIKDHLFRAVVHALEPFTVRD